MDSKPRSGGLSGEEKRIFMDMVTTLAPAMIFPVASAVPSDMTSFPLTKLNRALAEAISDAASECNHGRAPDCVGRRL